MRSLIFLSLVELALSQSLKLQSNWTGSNFFSTSNWNYKTGNDALDFDGQPGNNGNVVFLSHDDAQSKNLTFVNSAGNVVMKVDDTTVGDPSAGYGRDSVQLYSVNPITAGTLLVMDAVHIPFGCSVWPAFWMKGQNWPNNGEIDIIENVNLATNNQYSLHTLQGCTHPPASASSSLETGNLISTDCFNQTAGNQGCIVADNDKSYGQGFATNGGGVFAVQWNEDGIKIWFFTRSAVPGDLTSGSQTPNTANWGTPTAFYPSSSCDTSKFFGPQTLILETNVCGNFAVNVFSQTCKTGICTDLVPQPQNYVTAYWEIKYIALFSNSSSSSGTNTSSTGAPGATGGSGGGSSGAITATVGSKTLIAALSVASIGSFFALLL